MALPSQLKTARMTNDTLGVDIDNNVGALEQAICDILGFTPNVDVTESPLSCDNSGRLTKALLRLYAAGPVGVRYRDTTSVKEVRIALSGTNLVIDENTGTEGAPTWTNRASMAIATGVWTLTGIPVGPAANPTVDNELARKAYVDLCEKLANKGVASGYAGLDAGIKVPTAQLGGAGADATKVLFGDQSWKVLPPSKVVQVVNYQTGALATGTVIMPYDDTIPDIAEGNEYMSQAFTPTSTTNKLLIRVVFNGTKTVDFGVVALFKVGTSAALAAAPIYNIGPVCVAFDHYITSGTTAAITFTVRAGPHTAGTMTFNGDGGVRKLGGVMASSITITEIMA